MNQRFQFFGVSISVIALIALNIGVEGLLTASDWGVLPRNLRILFYAFLAFWAPLLHGGQPLFPGQQISMFVTYSFLHAGLLHLVVNMMALFSFGNVIVRRIGQKRFLVTYLLSALSGSVGYALLADSTNPMVGASGALFGLLGVWVCWDYLDRRHYGESLWVTGRALVFLIAYNLVFWILLNGQLAWETHLGGFVGGWLIALFWGRDVHLQSRRRRKLAPRRVPPK